MIAIIGILSSVVLASLNSARTKARDARRSADIKQVQTALELYYDGNGNGFYVPSNFSVVLDSALTGPLTPTYMSKIPVSPTGSYEYYNGGDASYYAIYIPYESKSTCYVCGGSACKAGQGWWGVNICQ